MTKYQPQEFEKKWVEKWDKEKTYKTEDPSKDKQKMYVLDMFPYPSGAGLHVGHPRGYTATDILARFYRMNGYAVLHPMGWDAFGLPAENAAIKAKKNPMDMVPQNIENFKRQMKMLGLSYDWDRELATIDPNYYGYTQWLFTLFFKLGLLYKKDTPVNFCPVCKTGLAEEEVLAGGIHERCGCPIIKKELPQWIFKITAYADSLLEGLKGLDWPEGVLEMQKNWIGKKEGMELTYEIVDAKGKKALDKITVFTTRPDTNFGATFVVLAPEHKLVDQIRDKFKIPDTKLEEINQYVEKAKSKSDLERIAEGRKKTGVFTGFYAVNNLTQRLMPIWISDFVLADVGTGAVVGVPGHDIRDFEFAQKFDIEIIRVVVGSDRDTSPILKKEQVQEKEGTMINSGFLNGLEIHIATKKIMDYLETKGWGKRKVSYHLRDWIFSRQRYWGEPIPMIFCKKCADNKRSYWNLEKFQKSKIQNPKSKKGNQSNNILDQKISERVCEIEDNLYGWFPLEENSLPLKLPYLKYYEPSETGESPLAKAKDWVSIKCRYCGGEARRETDTMPNWAGSCWYFLAFSFWNQEKASSKLFENWKTYIKNWLPVDWYFGGAEHAVLHLLYSRFWIHILNDVGIIDFREPFLRLRNVGMVLAQDHRKMSKSFGNVVNPDKVVEEYGADTLRVYEMFMAPFSQEIAWSDKTLQGAFRFLSRIWQIYHDPAYVTNDDNNEDNDLIVELQKVINKVTSDITDVKYNTAIASMMEFINAWQKIANQNGNKIQPLTKTEKTRKLTIHNAKKFLQIISPFAPFITEEIWHEVFSEKESIHKSSWPIIEKKLLVEEKLNIPVQVQGKLRGLMIVSSKELSEKEVVKKALNIPNINKWLNERKYKVIYIKGKILNFIFI